MRRVILIHGFNVHDGGASTVDLLIPGIKARGFRVVEYDYGWRGLLGSLLLNQHDADKLILQHQPGDIYIGHSNGCAILSRAIDDGLGAENVIFIHPALDRDWEPPENTQVKYLSVFYSSRDRATRAARFIPWVRWGEMGTVGPTSKHPSFWPLDDGYRHSEGFVKNPDLYLQPITWRFAQ
ncbi:MAG: hypothetical protein KAS32_01905 [Candidatus Peribacteraceae bacterium]|nr:hypothetical protein [Candidatus Peribacteraceae bacterium]